MLGRLCLRVTFHIHFADVEFDVHAYHSDKIMAELVHGIQLGWRANHSSEILGDDLILWGGNQDGLPLVHDTKEKRLITAKLDVLNLPTMKWSTVSTTGITPAGVMNNGVTTSGDEMYVFGGRCDGGMCCHNELYYMNTKNRVWRSVQSTDGPMEKSGCGFIAYSFEGSDYLLALGGKRSEVPPSHPQPNALNIPDLWGDYYTNEVHIMNLTTSPGIWISPAINGARPPPIAFCTLNMLCIDKSKAVLFGGKSVPKKNKSRCSNDIYVLSLTNNTVNFTKVQATSAYPKPRNRHSSSIITGGHQDHLLIIGGRHDVNTIPDSWIMNMSTKKWVKIDLPEVVCGRWSHSASIVTIKTDTQWIIITGGYGMDHSSIKGAAVTIIVELEYIQGKWLVQGIWNYSQEIELLERMNQLRPAINTKHQNENEELAMEIQQLQQQLKAAQERILQGEKMLQEQTQIVHQLQQEKQSIIEQKNLALQALQNTIKIKDVTIKTNEETIIQQQEEIVHNFENSHWLIQEEEVEKTQEILGSGGWGQVTVGIFRGTRVAVKSLHQVIISDYNKQLFVREMDIASRVRHPNLLLFIGATKVGNPLILTELMPTSLRKELEKSPLTKLQVITIGINVASALNYLHCWKPQPILHRDVSSANVLLEPSGKELWKAKLSDYGSANLLDNIQTLNPGNPVYSAPEANDPFQHSPAMDVYSFGILMAEMSTRKFPSTKMSEKVAQIASVQWQTVKQLIQSCTSHDQNIRPSTYALLQHLKLLQV